VPSALVQHKHRLNTCCILFAAGIKKKKPHLDLWGVLVFKSPLGLFSNIPVYLLTRFSLGFDDNIVRDLDRENDV
jgi:hypothetical protein